MGRHSREGWRRHGRLAIVALGVLVLAPSVANADCRQALVFALDVSDSVDEAEYRQQLGGLAGALEDPSVLDAILGDPAAPMAVAAFEWSSQEHATLIVDWTMLGSEADVVRVTSALRAWERVSAPRETAVGAGLEMAAAILQRAPRCWEHTIDISADGKNNDGPSPKLVHEGGTLTNVTVNALVVGTSADDSVSAAAELEGVRAYLEENVISGPGSFVAVAQSYEDYTRAMRQKLLKEIAGRTTGAAFSAGNPG